VVTCHDDTVRETPDANDIDVVRAYHEANDSVPSPPQETSQMDAANALNGGQEAPSENALSERDREILNFERQWWKYAGAKEQAVREQFDMSSTRYYQVLNALIDRPEALAFDPLLVRRLRRLRATRQRARSARRLGFEV
jgi:hypothetical protein